MPWESYSFKRADAPTRRGLALIGRAVLRRRHQVGISQRQLQMFCGVHQTVISRLENGRLTNLKWSRFAELVDALDGLADTDPRQAWMARYLPPNDDSH
jgi:transcriptional regulator with XRE-family HTH domain